MRGRRFWLVAVLGLLLVVCACGKDDKQVQRRKAVPVSVVTAETGVVPVRLRAVGNMEPLRSVAVRTQVGGQIVEQRVRDGQEVAAADVLFVLDRRPFLAALKDAQGRLERDQAQLKKAEDDYARYTGLRQKDVVSQQQFDQAQSDAMSLRGSIKLSEAQIDQAKLQLEYSTITAPIAGRVGSVLVNQGNIIKANDDRNLLVINQVQPIYAVFALPEQHLPEIAARMAKGPVRVLAYPAGDEKTAETGTLAALDNAVDRTTGTIKLKALFDNAGKRLWPGQFVRCVLELSDLEGVLLPDEAVQVGLQGNYVYVVRANSTCEFRPVETAGSFEGRTVVAKGVAVGETVVRDGHVRLAPDVQVEVKSQGQGQGS